MQSSNLVIQIHPSDNAIVATRDLTAGTNLAAPSRVTLRQDVPMGHKIAIAPINEGDRVLKYGQPIGVASQAILPGDWIHTHNIRLADGDQAYEFGTACDDPPRVSNRTFEGYVRSSGKVGTRNYVGIISSVNCSASVTRAIARHFNRERLAAYPNVDGVVAFTHHGGCAMQFGGQQHQLLNRVLGGMARHPNIGGYVLIGLGCEKGTIEYLIDDQKLVQIEGHASSLAPQKPQTLTLQATGGTAKTIAAGIELVNQILPHVNQATRQTVPASELIVATQCGGSDGNSGVTANPALGVACDRIIDEGGTAILGETTEISGAEQILTQRAVSESVGRRLIEKLEWWRWYAGVFGEQIDDNRSAGNAAGGLTTIAEKSLGAVAKAGSRRLVQVLDYADPVADTGLVMMDSPGFDPASITGMVAGGANLVVFTTGRGSCYGCKPAPSIKVATNTPMYERMKPDMDVNAGTILDGTPVETVGEEIFEAMLAVASGTSTKSENQNLGDEEFVPWMIGPVL